jgi:hypothetical protein
LGPSIPKHLEKQYYYFKKMRSVSTIAHNLPGACNWTNRLEFPLDKYDSFDACCS